jgi:hypothetical protein
MLVCVVAAAASGWVVSPWARRVNWVRYQPTFWLARQAEVSASPADRTAAMAVLQWRLKYGRLSAGDVSGIAERALRRQADRNTPWDMSWGDFVENGRAVRLVTEEQWNRYAAAALDYRFHVTPEARRRTGLTVRVESAPARLGNNSVLEVRSSEQWEVSGVPLDPYEGTGYSVVYHVHRASTYGGAAHSTTRPRSHWITPRFARFGPAPRRSS